MLVPTQMVSDILKELIDEAGEYRPLDGPEIGSLILLDRGEYRILPSLAHTGVC